MKILIIGKGGREHAFAWKLSQNNRVKQIFIADGNPGCELLSKVKCIKLKTSDELLNFAKDNSIDLTIVGSEELLVQGIVDKFQDANLPIFGPNQKSAMLEGSKSYSKEFMNKYGVRTAKHKSFTEYSDALNYLSEVSYPVVIKASGLAAGKGVVIAQNYDEADIALSAMLIEQVFGESGREVVIEEFLVGVEASILAFTDGNVILPLISAKDHKKIGIGETGLNTGGMGVIAPNPYVTNEVYQNFIHDILNPTLDGIKAENMNFSGVIFFGVMITDNGVYCLEYNMRMGDPETQAVLPLMKNDLLESIEACIAKKLSEIVFEWYSGSTCCVVLSSGGYPEHFKKGIPIRGIETFDVTDCYLFSAGVAKHNERFVTDGGRVLNIVAHGENLNSARKLAYQAVSEIYFDHCYFRTDIGAIL